MDVEYVHLPFWQFGFLINSCETGVLNLSLMFFIEEFLLPYSVAFIFSYSNMSSFFDAKIRNFRRYEK